MFWTYITVLSLGLLLGWKLSRLFDQISKTTSGPSSSSSGPFTQLSKTAEATKSVDMNEPELHETKPSVVETARLDQFPSKTVSVVPNADTSPTSQTLQLAYEMAHQMGQYKAGFLARTSHELRSPLNRVMSLQQLILADLCDSSEEERDFIRQSYEAAQELLELLDQTTAISKLEHGTANLVTEAVSLMTLLFELEMQTSLHAKNRNLRLSIEQPDTDIKLLSDPRWLRQVLLNLVTTPIYLMDSGHIDVTHEINTTANTLSITVTDERPSFGWSEPTTLLTETSKEKPKAIAPKATTTPEQTSSAWGLSLITTTKLVEVINGRLAILSTPTSSEEGKTAIQCTIPLL